MSCLIYTPSFCRSLKNVILNFSCRGLDIFSLTEYKRPDLLTACSSSNTSFGVKKLLWVFTESTVFAYDLIAYNKLITPGLLWSLYCYLRLYLTAKKACLKPCKNLCCSRLRWSLWVLLVNYQEKCPLLSAFFLLSCFFALFSKSGAKCVHF